MRIGLHVSIAGKIYEAIDRAEELGCETIQVFSRNPRGWEAKPLDPEDTAEFRKRKETAGIFPVLVHIPYIINLATPDAKLRQKSIAAYIEDLGRTDALGAEYFVTHPGSHTGSGERAGIKHFTDSLNAVLEKAKPECMVLLENTAGSGSNLGYAFGHIKSIIDGIKDKKRIGVCFDTEHAYGARYDVSTKKGLEETLGEFDRLVGIEMIKAVHFNDSKAKLASGVDRHEHIGKGFIGKEGMKRIINHPRLRHLPFIMETPKKKPADDIMNMKTARSLCK